MKTAYVNDIWHGDMEVVRALIVLEKTIKEDFPILFDAITQNILLAAMKHPNTIKENGCHTFTRFCQFVVYFNYNKTLVNLNGGINEVGISIELLYFGTSDNPNDVFDYMLKLRNAGWEEQSREKIIQIANEIKSDYDKTWLEIAEIKIKDHWESPSSYI